jgi:outer membrane protein OmpA-like peptidoglycan-associated protein
MKKKIHIFIALSLTLLLPGCIKKKAKKAKNTKVAQVDNGSGVPLARYKKGDKKFWDDRVEAFVLEEDDTDARYAQKFAKNDSFSPLTKDLKEAEEAWKLEAHSNQDFETVYFNFDDYSIRKNQEPVVAYNTEQAKQAVKEGKLVRVEGHSDKRCVSEVYNMAVSQKRAHTVADKLAKSGVKRDSLKVLGYGDTKLAVNASGKEERNRRVELSTLTA